LLLRAKPRDEQLRTLALTDFSAVVVRKQDLFLADISLVVLLMLLFCCQASKAQAEACVFRQERDALATRLNVLGQELDEERDAADQQLEELQQQLVAKEAALQ
jgi:hypothetical protein